MYRITICTDIYGYIAEQYAAEGITFSCESEIKVLETISSFVKKGFSVCVEPKTDEEETIKEGE